MKYPFTDVGGHVVATIDGFQCLVDTGCPLTFGPEGGFTFLGQTQSVLPWPVGVDAESTSGFIGTRIDILLGLDFLSQQPFTVDWNRSEIEFGRVDAGEFVSSHLLTLAPFGYPLLTGQVGGRDLRFLVDTGAVIAYLTKENLTGQPDETYRDFHYSVGWFDTPVWRKSIKVGKTTSQIRWGMLPPGLQQVHQFSDGVLSTEFLKPWAHFDLRGGELRLRRSLNDETRNCHTPLAPSPATSMELPMTLLRDLVRMTRVGDPVHLGTLTMIPLYGPTLPEADYITLGQALKDGLVSITETSESGTVPQLRAENRAPRPILLVDGEELVGAKQNRILNQSILLPGNRITNIPVSCVEQGRWHYRSRHFSGSDNTLYPSARRRKVADVTASMHQGARAANQSALWSDIDGKRYRHGTDSETGAMGDIYDSQKSRIRAYLDVFKADLEQSGAVFGLNGKIMGIEIFDSAHTFSAYLPKLVRSWGLDALEREDGPQEPVPAWEASTILADLADVEVKRFASVGLGEDLRFGNRTEPGAGLEYKGRVVHLVAFFDKG